MAEQAAKDETRLKINFVCCSGRATVKASATPRGYRETVMRLKIDALVCLRHWRRTFRFISIFEWKFSELKIVACWGEAVFDQRNDPIKHTREWRNQHFVDTFSAIKRWHFTLGHDAINSNWLRERKSEDERLKTENNFCFFPLSSISVDISQPLSLILSPPTIARSRILAETGFDSLTARLRLYIVRGIHCRELASRTLSGCEWARNVNKSLWLVFLHHSLALALFFAIALEISQVHLTTKFMRQLRVFEFRVWRLVRIWFQIFDRFRCFMTWESASSSELWWIFIDWNSIDKSHFWHTRELKSALVGAIKSWLCCSMYETVNFSWINRGSPQCEH